MFTISMLKVEVKQSPPMLVGYEIRDSAQANRPAPMGKPAYSMMPNGPITVDGRVTFLPNIIGFNGSDTAACMQIIYSSAPNKFAAATKVFYFHG